MTTKVDASEQVKFLVSCIAHTNNGKPDFQAVADELNIVTKAAAQKRYERMLKAHNVTKKPANANGDSDASKQPTPRKKRAAPGADATEGEHTPVKKTPAKRRRAVKKEEGSDDDEETKPTPTPKARTPRKAKAVKKEEPESDKEDVKDESKDESKDEPQENASATSKEDNDKAQDSPLSDAPPSGEDSAGEV